MEKRMMMVRTMGGPFLYVFTAKIYNQYVSKTYFMTVSVEPFEFYLIYCIIYFDIFHAISHQKAHWLLLPR